MRWRKVGGGGRRRRRGSVNLKLMYLFLNNFSGLSDFHLCEARLYKYTELTDNIESVLEEQRKCIYCSKALLSFTVLARSDTKQGTLSRTEGKVLTEQQEIM